MLLVRTSGPPTANRTHWGSHWVPYLLGAAAIVLLPWTAYLALTLPSSATARHWPLAWCGLDVAMAAGLAATAWAAIRRDRRAGLAAASTATFLVTDAWFDVCTASAGWPQAWAAAEACAEVAAAAGCLLVAWLIWRDEPRRGDRRGDRPGGRRGDR
jgi:hypothetical protein